MHRNGRNLHLLTHRGWFDTLAEKKIAISMCTKGVKNLSVCKHVGYSCHFNRKCHGLDGTVEPTYCPSGTVPNGLECGTHPAFGCYDERTRSCKDKDGVALFDPIGGVISGANKVYNSAMSFAFLLFGGTGKMKAETQIKTNDFLQNNWAALSALPVSKADEKIISSWAVSAVQTVRKKDIEATIKRVTKRVVHRGGGKMMLTDVLINGLLYNEIRKSNPNVKYQDGKILDGNKPAKITHGQIMRIIK